MSLALQKSTKEL